MSGIHVLDSLIGNRTPLFSRRGCLGRRTKFALIPAALAAALAARGQAPAPGNRADRLEWFRDAGFGRPFTLPNARCSPLPAAERPRPNNRSVPTITGAARGVSESNATPPRAL